LKISALPGTIASGALIFFWGIDLLKTSAYSGFVHTGAGKLITSRLPRNLWTGGSCDLGDKAVIVEKNGTI
jgi:hypothetical protein